VSWTTIYLWGPVAVYMAAIFYSSSFPTAPLPSDISDKVMHMVSYAGLAVLVTRALTGALSAPISRRHAVFALLLTIGYGVSDEIHQWFVPTRSADLLDVYADSGGALIGLVACWAWGIIWPRLALGRGASRHEL
jgi:VanZ family protein